MMRLLIIICSLSFVSTYAMISDDTNKKIPIDHGVDHPDHVPHHGGKDPIKKVTQDDVIFPKKRRKIGRGVTV